MNNPPRIPSNARLLGESPEFTEETVPAALRSRHETAPDRWAELCVLEGQLRFCDLVTGEDRHLATDEHQVIAPASPHRLAFEGPVRFQLRFYAVTPQ